MDTEESRHFVSYTRWEIVQTLLIGVVVGLVVWGLEWLLNKYVFTPLMCKNEMLSKCSESASYAAITAQVVAAIAGVIALVQRRIYRPLLVALAAAITLWGLLSIVSDWTWYGQALACLVLYAIAYASYMLLARIRALPLSIIAILVLLVVTRLVLNS